MSEDARYELASKLANEISIRAEELSTAIYEASKYGYRVSLRVRNVIPIEKSDSEIRLIGADKSVDISATVNFDIGKAVL